MKKQKPNANNVDFKGVIFVAIGALFFGGGFAYFLTQKPATLSTKEVNNNSTAIARKLSPTPQEKMVRISNDKQLMIELIAQNHIAIKESQVLVKTSKNVALKVKAQEIINSLQKESVTLNDWLSSNYGIVYNANFGQSSPTANPTITVESDSDKRYVSAMTLYISVTTEMINQVMSMDLLENVKEYLPKALELRKKLFYDLDDIEIKSTSSSSTLDPQR